MKAQLLGGLVVSAVLALLAAPVAWAEDCSNCDSCDESCACGLDNGSTDFIEIGVTTDDVTGSTDSNDQRGLYPENWLTSGRVRFSGSSLARDRFELRWQDVSSENGRAWGRLSLWPATLEFDGMILDNYAWNMYSSLALQHQEISHDDIKLRFHDGELDNMLLRYETREYNRDTPAPLYSFNVNRLTYQYNFNLGCDSFKGSLRQIATAIEAPRTGSIAGESDSTVLKLDARLNDKLDLYGRGTYTMFNYENLADDEFYSTDYTVGLRFQPHPSWELQSDYRAKEYPDDNAVGSHVEGLDSYSATVAYIPGCGNRIEAGYRHKSIDYAQLHLRDTGILPLLRGTAQVTPGDVAGSVSSLTPEQDETWMNFHWAVTPRLSTDTRFGYAEGDAPGTDLVAVSSASLFYNEHFKTSSNWYYDVNGNDQLALLYSRNESSNDARDSNFAMRYLEGSWTRCVGGDGYFTMAVSNTEAAVDAFGIIDGEYNADDTTYRVGYTDGTPCIDYGLDLALTNGGGSQQYDQMAVGADIECKRLGPVNLRVDWFDRNYDANPVFDTEALEVALSYRISF